MPAGRPTEYKLEYCELAQNYCLLGATNEDLAGFFGVSRRTVDNWIAAEPPFAEAVRGARALADARVARSLYERAIGFSYRSTRTVLHRGEERELSEAVYCPPDVRACIFWLRNRQRDHWSDKQPLQVPHDGDLEAAMREGRERVARLRQEERIPAVDEAV
ncbi:MAG: helix-turn-helix domain-containing protein [Alphaproteobacteria bacterium]|nr:helix-turn-helix domain-containing protein [Alphaproteobacteria bacterium]